MSPGRFSSCDKQFVIVLLSGPITRFYVCFVKEEPKPLKGVAPPNGDTRCGNIKLEDQVEGRPFEI